jgi:hypothetical protein
MVVEGSPDGSWGNEAHLVKLRRAFSNGATLGVRFAVVVSPLELKFRNPRPSGIDFPLAEALRDTCPHGCMNLYIYMVYRIPEIPDIQIPYTKVAKYTKSSKGSCVTRLTFFGLRPGVFAERQMS